VEKEYRTSLFIEEQVEMEQNKEWQQWMQYSNRERKNESALFVSLTPINK
jgi:hypothetical protein